MLKLLQVMQNNIIQIMVFKVFENILFNLRKYMYFRFCCYALRQIKLVVVVEVQKDCVKVSTVHKSLNILQIADIYDLEIAKIMHSFYHNDLPKVFDNYFKSANTHHTHNTRSITHKNYYLQKMNFH